MPDYQLKYTGAEVDEAIGKALSISPESSGADLMTVYPVGSIYMSVNETSPASLFGGTWEQLKDRFLLGAGDDYTVGSTGGAATHKLPLGNAGYAKISISGAQQKLYSDFINTDEWGYKRSMEIAIGTNSGTFNYGTPLAGTTGSGDTMPPYLSVYMWKRVS